MLSISVCRSAVAEIVDPYTKFQPVVDLQTYPAAIFNLFMTVGLYIVRHRRRKLGLPRAEFRAWDASVVFNIAANLFLVIMPWYPPATGRDGGDVGFWYATYVVVGIATLVSSLIPPVAATVL